MATYGSIEHNPLSFFELLKQYIGPNPSIGPQMTAAPMGGIQNTFQELMQQLSGYENQQYTPNVGSASDQYSINPLGAGDVMPSLYNLPDLSGLVQNVQPGQYGRNDFDIGAAISDLLGQRGDAPQFGVDSIGSMGRQLDRAAPQRQAFDLSSLFGAAQTNLSPQMTRWGDRPLPEYDYGSIL